LQGKVQTVQEVKMLHICVTETLKGEIFPAISSSVCKDNIKLILKIQESGGKDRIHLV
jgi:hypothetical protein